MSTDSKDPKATAAYSSEQFRAQLKGIETQLTELDDDENRINENAGELESRIRSLAKENAELKKLQQQLEQKTAALEQRRHAIEEEARSIGQKRTKILKARDILGKERSKLLEKIFQVESQLKIPPAPQQAAEEKPVASRSGVEIEISFNSDHNFYTGVSEDISSGGVFIATHNSLPIGTQLDITILLPDKSNFTVGGTVQWVREYSKLTADFAPGIGVQFDKLDQAATAKIKEFISQRSPVLYEPF
jgi:uncharacterized protein (TIGR02266 family)